MRISLAYLLNLFEIGTGSRPTFPKLFLTSSINVSVRTDWNPKGPHSCHLFNRSASCHSTPALPDRAVDLQFIDTTFEKAKLNVRINGKKFEDLKDQDDGTFVTGDARGSVSWIEVVGVSDREAEPFDEALDRETWSLYNQRLQWDLELATKRRKRPQEVAELLENLFKVQEAALEELDRTVEEDDEDRPDASLPDGQLVVLFAGPAADIHT